MKNYAQYIDLAIVLVQEVLQGIGKSTNTEQSIVGDVQSALNALLKVQGSDVTYAQLESLRATKEW